MRGHRPGTSAPGDRAGRAAKLPAGLPVALPLAGAALRFLVDVALGGSQGLSFGGDPRGTRVPAGGSAFLVIPRCGPSVTRLLSQCPLGNLAV